MIQGLYNVITGLAVVALVYLNLVSPNVGTAMFERTKWVGDYFAVGSAEQFQVDQDGDVSSTGTVAVAEFTQGGGILDLTDANGGTYTLTQAELLGSNVLKFTAGGAGQAVIALTLPATSTLTSLLPNAGDTRQWIYDASALVAATTTTVTAGTGVDLIAYTANDDVIDGAEFAVLTCWRQTDTDVSCITSELLNAD